MKKSVFQFEERSLSFNDVAIYQQKNKAKSRMDVDISSEIIRGVVRSNPLIAANMSTVVNAEFYKQLYSLGGMAFLHRAQSIENQIAEIKEVAKHCEWVGFSIGVGTDYKKNVSKMIKAGGNICLIDIAHGYSDEVINLGRWIKNKHPKVKVVVGNTNNTDMMNEVDFADAVKIGIGGGKACRTANTAGCTENQWSVINRFAPISKKLGLPIISCGAIREGADFSKAIAAGASSTMIGSIFAATPESNAVMKYTLDGKFKVYSGMACYSQDTEILTETGWKLIKDLDQTESVATLNQKTHELEYQIPTAIQNYDYSGNMVHVKSDPIDLLVTPNHRMYVSKRHSVKGIGKYRFVNAEDTLNLKRNTSFIYKKDCNWTGIDKEFFSIPGLKKDLLMNDWLDFFGFWLAEGSATKYQIHKKTNNNHYSYSISLSNNKKELIDNYNKILNSWGVKTHTRLRQNNYEICFNNKYFYNYLQQFGKASTKFIPYEFKMLPKEKLEILLNSIYLGDGCVSRKSIYTSSTKLRDDLMEIAIKCGRTPNTHINHLKGSIGQIKNGKPFIRNHNVWTVYIGDNHKNVQLTNKNHVTEQYEGKVYCVTVPNSIVCVRRNGKYSWCGNSKDVQVAWKGGLKDGACAEGTTLLLPMSEPLEQVVNHYTGALRSAITYSGTLSVKEMQRKVKWVKL